MPRDVRLLSKWLVFINGVEIPHLGFTLTFGKNAYAQGTINLEPDSLVHQFRPNSLVHIFFYDEFDKATMTTDEQVEGTTDKVSPSMDDVLYRYRLYFEGEMTGVSHTKSPTSRSMAVDVAGLFRIFDRHKMFQSSLGGSFTSTTLVTGGFAIKSMSESGGFGADALSVAGLAGFFDPNNLREKPTKAAFRDSAQPDFAERILGLITFMASYNGSVRLSTVRTRLINKIAGVPDTTLRDLLTGTLANPFFQQSQGAISGDESILALVARYCNLAFYSWYQIPGPFTPPSTIEAPILGEKGFTIQQVNGQPDQPELVKLPKDLTNETVFAFIRDYYRNDFIFVPELYYAMPPPCNFFFPEDLTSLSFGRTFDSEPTRYFIEEPYFTAGRATYFAPMSVFRHLSEDARKKLSAAEVFGANIGAWGKRTSDSSYLSPYLAPPHGGNQFGNINLLTAMSDAEIEKGIICGRGFHDMELFSGIANIYKQDRDLKSKKAGEGSSEKAAGRKFAGLTAGFGAGDGSKEHENPYIRLMTRLVSYRLSLAQSTRNIQISCPGHKWAVPGFSAIVFDKDMSYLAFVDSLTYAVDVSSGTETTTVSLSRARAVPYTSLNSVEDVKRAQDALVEKQKKGYAKAAQEYDKMIEKVKEARNKFQEAATKQEKQWALYEVTGTKLFEEMIEATDVLNTYGEMVKASLYPKGGAAKTSAAVKYFSDNPDTPSSPAYITNKEENVAGYAKQFLPLFNLGWSKDARRLELNATNTDYPEDVMAYTVDNILDWVEQAQKLEHDIISYLEAQQAALKESAKSGLKPEIDTLGNAFIIENITLGEASNLGAAELIADLTGFFVPPPWFNDAFLRMSTIDKIYQGLLGCQPFYSVMGKGGVSPEEELTPQKTFEEYQRFLQAIDQVFPILVRGGYIPPTRTGKSIWEQKSDQSEAQAGPHRWFVERLQRREITKLGDFLQKHGLRLDRVVSAPPTPHRFFMMVPEKEEKGLNGFDNSLFSMIVDEWQMFPDLIPAEAKVAKVDKRDPQIHKLRTTPGIVAYLKREERQRPVREYSERHFGARAFDGR